MDRSKPPSELPPLLARTLLCLPKLQSLHLDLRQHHVEPWISAIKSTGLVLPGVQTLVLDHLCVSLVSFCPNVSTVRITFPWGATVDWKETLKTALTAEKLTNLQLTNRWDIEMVDGTLLSFYYYYQYNSYITKHSHLSLAPLTMEPYLQQKKTAITNTGDK